jgi:acetyl esterase/lipase
VADARLDVYLPTGVEAPYPTVVYVTPPAFTDENVMRYYAPHLIEQGYAAVGVRIRPQESMPDSFCGLAWVHANAGEYGFDTQRIVAFGISGSGPLVAMLGAIDRGVDNPYMTMTDCPHPEPEGPWVQGIVAYEGVFMTPVALDQELQRNNIARLRGLPRAEVDALFDLLIATPPAEWRDIQDTDPAHRRLIDGFSLGWLDGSEPPFLLIYGSASEYDWMGAEQQFFASQLEAVGVPVEVVEKEGLIHRVDALAGHTEEMDTFLAEIFGRNESTQQRTLERITPGNAE